METVEAENPLARHVHNGGAAVGMFSFRKLNDLLRLRRKDQRRRELCFTTNRLFPLRSYLYAP